MIDKRVLFLEAFIAIMALSLLLVSSVAHSKESAASAAESLTFMAEMPGPPERAVHWGRDPFVPLVSGSDSPEMKLTAIFFNDTTPSAIINGEIVYKESTVMGQKVIDIEKTHVILQGTLGQILLEIARLPKYPKAEQSPASETSSKSGPMAINSK
ncbi:MAG: hypothetical protein IME99_09325 [Proteobacteria bacterium]|nr:hypothetical protein [Pseudomonadota bacterium]